MSCTKDEITPLNSSSPETKNVKEDFLAKQSGSRTYFDNDKHPGVEGEDYGCKAGGNDCLNTVDVVGAVGPIINDIGDESDAGNSSNVISLVKNNKQLLERVVATSLLDDVVSKTLQLTVRGRVTSASNAYLVFSNGSRIISVTPVSM